MLGIYLLMTQRNGDRLECRQADGAKGRRKTGSAMSFTRAQWSRVREVDRSASRVGMKLGNWNWRTGRRINVIFLIPRLEDMRLDPTGSCCYDQASPVALRILDNSNYKEKRGYLETGVSHYFAHLI